MGTMGQRVRWAVLACCLGWACGSAAAEAPGDSPAFTVFKTAGLLRAGTEPVRIVCLGDSVTGVYYHTGGRRAYPEMLPIALKRLYPNAQVEVFNAGISGNTTADALKRLDSDVLAHKPHLVTVMFGLNDMTRVPLEEFKANLLTIIQKCHEAGAEVMLCTPNSVTDTPPRPTAKLLEYVAGVRQVGERVQTPTLDCYAAYEAVRAEDPFQWLMIMSDEIHPNMVGHKLFAERIAQAVSDRPVSLEDEGPPRPALPTTLALIGEGRPVRIYAMPPYDRLVSFALKAVVANTQTQVTSWPVEGLTLPQIEESAKKVRDLKPDLVIVAVPVEAKADTKEQFVRSYKWVLNYALSFGHQEWDCMAIVPSVTNPVVDADAQERDRLAKSLIWAQDIGMVERKTGDSRPPEEVVAAWLRGQLAE